MAEETAPVPDRDLFLLAQVREAFGRVVYSHKTHEKQADICFSKHRWQQGVLIALTAISSGTFLAAVVGLLGAPALTSLATSSIALLVSWMSLGAKTFKFEEEADAHRSIASRLWDVRESYISLIADLMSGSVADAEGRERRDELQEAARDAYANAPRASTKAYEQASEGLQHNEEMTFTPRGPFPPPSSSNVAADFAMRSAVSLSPGNAQKHHAFNRGFPSSRTPVIFWHTRRSPSELSFSPDQR